MSIRKAVAYLRVSTDGQVGEDRFGIESQRVQITEYAAKNGIEIVDWFIDEGVSGASTSRPAFDRLLNGEITNPPVEAVIVAKTDRIARDVNIYYYYKAELNKREIEVISTSEDWSAQDKLTALILENFLAVAATLERENICRRTSGGRRVKAAKGGYSGGRPPYGYRADTRTLVVVPDEAEVVRTIFRMKDGEGQTYKAICEHLNALGKTNRSGTKFSISTVQTIYENKNVYRGFYRYGQDADWIEGQHEAILTEDGVEHHD